MSTSPSSSRTIRSALFVPGNRPERFDKAVASGAHGIILDLEDAVAEGAKGSARDAISDWLDGGLPACVRINDASTTWFADDVAMVREHPNVSVMLPKAEGEALARLTATLPDREIVALVETIAGYVGVRDVATNYGVARLAFGSVDFSVESGIEDVAEGLTAVRTQLVIESRFAGLVAPLDGVSVEVQDVAALEVAALRSRQLGFGGKMCIHPKQVEPVNSAFLPSVEQVAWAQRVVEAFVASGGSATKVDGEMIDKPVVERATAMLAEVEK